MPTLRESVESTREKIRRLRGQRPQQSSRQMREEALAKGNLAYKQRLEAQRVGKENTLRRLEYERQLAEYNKQLAEEKARLEAEEKRLQQEAEDERKRQQMEFWRQNRERMSFVDYGSGPLPLYGTQAVYQSQVYNKETGKYEFTSEAKAQIEKRRALVEQQLTRIEQQYGRTKADEAAAKMGVEIVRPTPEKESEKIITSEPGKTLQQTLIERGYSKSDIQNIMKDIEKSPGSYKIVESTDKRGTSLKAISVEQERYNKQKEITEKRYESLTPAQKVYAHAHTLLSPKSWEYITASVPTEKIPFLKEGVGAKTGRDVVIEEAMRVSTPGYKVPKTTGMKLAVGAAESVKSAPVQIELLALGAQGFGLASATSIGGKVVAAPVTKIAMLGVGAYYYGGRTKEAYGLVKEQRYEEAIGIGIRTGAETGAMAVGARSAIRSLTTYKAMELPPAERAEFFKKFGAVERLKDVKIKEVDLSKVERIPGKKAANIVATQIKTRGLILGGSSAEQAQLKAPNILKPHDIDLYSPWYRNPVKEAKLMEELLVAGGVKRVSRIRAEVTIAGEKAIEIHPASEFLYSNIKTVERIVTPVATRIGKTPSGIKVLKIKPQLKRELVAGMLEGSAKHYERFGQTFPDVLSQQATSVGNRMKGLSTIPFGKFFKGETVEPVIADKTIKIPTIKTPQKYPSYNKYPSYILGTAPYEKIEVYKPQTIYRTKPPIKVTPYKGRPIEIIAPYKGKKPDKPPIIPPYKGKKPIKVPPYKPIKTKTPPYVPKTVTKIAKPNNKLLPTPGYQRRVKKKAIKPPIIWRRKYAYRPSLTGISKGGKEETIRISSAPTGKVSPIKFRYRVKNKMEVKK